MLGQARGHSGQGEEEERSGSTMMTQEGLFAKEESIHPGTGCASSSHARPARSIGKQFRAGSAPAKKQPASNSPADVSPHNTLRSSQGHQPRSGRQAFRPCGPAHSSSSSNEPYVSVGQILSGEALLQPYRHDKGNLRNMRTAYPRHGVLDGCLSKPAPYMSDGIWNGSSKGSHKQTGACPAVHRSRRGFVASSAQSCQIDVKADSSRLFSAGEWFADAAGRTLQRPSTAPAAVGAVSSSSAHRSGGTSSRNAFKPSKAGTKTLEGTFSPFPGFHAVTHDDGNADGSALKRRLTDGVDKGNCSAFKPALSPQRSRYQRSINPMVEVYNKPTPSSLESTPA